MANYDGIRPVYDCPEDAAGEDGDGEEDEDDEDEDDD